jgi:hypothetical protein
MLSMSQAQPHSRLVISAKRTMCVAPKVPEIAEGLPLHHVEQRVVFEIEPGASRRRAFLGCARTVFLTRFCFGLGPHCSPLLPTIP